MVKPKKKRPTDPNQLAASVVADVIQISGKPVKPSASRRRKRGIKR